MRHEQLQIDRLAPAAARSLAVGANEHPVAASSPCISANTGATIMTTPSQPPTTGPFPDPAPPRGPFRRAGVIRRHRARFRPAPANREAAKRRRGQVILSLVCLALLTTSLLGGFAQSALAVRVTPADPGPAPVLNRVVNSSSHSGQLVISGTGFTPGAKVYIAVYDQAGRNLYEHRSVSASKRVTAYEAGILNNRGAQNATPSDGGAIDETFTGLCGAAIMTRALDFSTSRWTNWVTATFGCAASNGGRFLPASSGTLSLPVANDFVSTAPGHKSVQANQPLLLATAAESNAPGVASVSGLGFTGGGQVYVAVYDQMGTKIFPNRWVTAAKFYSLDGEASSASVPVVAKQPTGAIHLSFDGLCASRVMIRAYDQTTESWSNWVNVTVQCGNGDYPTASTAPDAHPYPIDPGHPTKQ